MATLVQSTVGYKIFPIPGGDLGPGTIGGLTITVPFTKHVTSGNYIVLAFDCWTDSGAPGSQIQFYPPRASIFQQNGGSSHTLINFTAGWSLNTPLGETGIVYATQMAPNDTTGCIVYPPNPNNFSNPGWNTWNCYGALGVLQLSGILPTDTYPTTGNAPPNPFKGNAGSVNANPVNDTMGNIYTQCVWIGSGTTGQGNGAAGMWTTVLSGSGSNAIKINLGAFNNNPFLGPNAIIAVVAVEISGSIGANISSNTISNAGPSTITVPTTDSLGGTENTVWTSAPSSCLAQVIDQSPSSGTDFWFASLLNASSSLTPTVTPGGTYSRLGTVIVPTTPSVTPFTLWGFPITVPAPLLQPQVWVVV